MRVLIVGGTRFVGHFLTWRLIAEGHEVTLLNRGTIRDPFGDRIKRVIADRRALGAWRALDRARFDATVDFAAYTASDVRTTIDGLGDRAGHYVFISTGQVYLVREDCPQPSKEEDYDGPLIARVEKDGADWDYGIGKRDSEDLLVRAWSELQFPSTRLRIPMVNGERDHYRRIESYLRRILDGGPVLLPENRARPMRHVYSGAVVDAIARMLTRSDTYGEAFNLAQDETPTLPEMVRLLAEILGAPDRGAPVEDAKLRGAGLMPKDVSPFSDPWMSSPDPTRAKARLQFVHPPVATYLEKIVAVFLSHPPPSPPLNYKSRALEISLV